MAADSSFSHIIFFIASILVAVSVAGVIIGISGSMAQEIKLKADSAVSEMGTSVVLLNDPREVPYSNGTLTLYLKNTGDISQDYDDIMIFIDGQYVTRTVVPINGNAAALAPGGTVRLDAEAALGPGDHSVKAAVAHGGSAAMDFRI